MGHRRLTFEKVYDFPAEADMLIIYHKVDGEVLYWIVRKSK
jgi:hypothetical protein